jgi:adenylate kinase family enzyme
MTKPLPQIIILYGPPAAGKGTQAHFLKDKLPDYYHLDFGSELRQFVKQHLGAFGQNETEQPNSTSSPEELQVARRVRDLMLASKPVETADLRYVIESSIVDCLNRNQGMLIEGPGRLVEEAQWLSEFLAQKQAEVVIFHLYISLNEVLERSRNRYYLPSTKKPFTSYEEAIAAAQNGEEPYRRPEDDDEANIESRYRSLYADNFAQIISIYQLTAKAQIFNLDARQNISQVSHDILQYFQVFYNQEL